MITLIDCVCVFFTKMIVHLACTLHLKECISDQVSRRSLDYKASVDCGSKRRKIYP